MSDVVLGTNIKSLHVLLPFKGSFVSTYTHDETFDPSATVELVFWGSSEDVEDIRWESGTLSAANAPFTATESQIDAVKASGFQKVLLTQTIEGVETILASGRFEIAGVG
jgi:hypothetical protein